MPNPDFTPLSHAELRKRWREHDHDFCEAPDCPDRRLILSAIYWEAQAYLAVPKDRAQEDFVTKLREIRIDWREDG